jgi:hypothetical protein
MENEFYTNYEDYEKNSQENEHDYNEYDCSIYEKVIKIGIDNINKKDIPKFIENLKVEASDWHEAANIATIWEPKTIKNLDNNIKCEKNHANVEKKYGEVIEKLKIRLK